MGHENLGLDTDFLHHFPLWRLGFKLFKFSTQNSTLHNGFISHYSCLSQKNSFFFLVS